jgi:hypothetical protein
MSQTENPTLIFFADGATVASAVATAAAEADAATDGATDGATDAGATDAGAGVAALEHAETMSAVLTAASRNRLFSLTGSLLLIDPLPGWIDLWFVRGTMPVSAPGDRGPTPRT